MGLLYSSPATIYAKAPRSTLCKLRKFSAFAATASEDAWQQLLSRARWGDWAAGSRLLATGWQAGKSAGAMPCRILERADGAPLVRQQLNEAAAATAGSLTHSRWLYSGRRRAGATARGATTLSARRRHHDYFINQPCTP